jgi:hypothetical protein
LKLRGLQAFPDFNYFYSESSPRLSLGF